MKSDLTEPQREVADAAFNILLPATAGELRLGIESCFFASMARGILESLNGYPWYFDEEETSRRINKSKSALSLVKVPGKLDSQSPVAIALRALWNLQLSGLTDADELAAIRLLFRRRCSQYFERLGIQTLYRMLSNDNVPERSNRFLTSQELRMIQDWGWA